MYRLVALDVDGTILDSQGEIPERVKRAVSQARQKGVAVVLATGRRYRAALPIAEALGLTWPIILHSGALLVEPAGQPLWHRPLAQEVALEIITEIHQAGLAALFFRHTLDGPEVYYERPVPEPSYQKFLEARPQEFRRVPDLGQACQGEVDKVMTLTPSLEEAENLAARFSRLRGEPLRAIRTLSRGGFHYLEVFRADTSKWEALAFLAGRWRISPEEIIAIGDHINDLEMIEGAGLGVAMGNALPEVKARAKLVTASNDDAGVAEVLERYIL